MKIMMSTVACRLGVLLMVCAMAAAGCGSQEHSIVCSANGVTYLCPEGKVCGGVQQLCLEPASCGNGVVDLNEQCDDGNVRDADGCSKDCRIEVCGNGTKDPGEICDDGNTKSGDGCSADCQSKEVCGNGILDRAAGEVCDDGVGDGMGGASETKDGDGCSADCMSTEICGNHIKDVAVGEVCDDGNNVDADGCSADCRSKEGCDNGTVELDEECDHDLYDPDTNPNGNHNDRDCRDDCVINRCGDGYVDTQAGPQHEECDGAPPATNRSRLFQPKETSACNLDCTLTKCGDGKINKSAGEECDDGQFPALDGDGCSALCKIEFCGNGKVDNGEPCDPSVNAPGCNADCTPNECGDGKLNKAAGEQCDDDNTDPNDGCSPTCKFEHCGNGVLDFGEECDLTAGLQPCNTKTCLQEICGNGVLDNDNTTDVHEACDDGNKNNDDGCSSACVVEFCGDGKRNNREACDPTDPLFGASACNTDCTTNACGDGKLNPAASEACDDGNDDDDDGCSSQCVVEFCRDGKRNNHEACDPTDPLFGPAACNTDCTTTACGDGKLNPAASEACDDGNDDNDDGCSKQCVVEFCGDGHRNNHEVCDPSDPAFGPAACNTDCTTNHCGDGKLNPSAGEVCDDGNEDDNDGCSSTCKFEKCGDGIRQPPEECDQSDGPQPCSPSCHREFCGNGFVDVDLAATPPINEKCDLGAANSLTGACLPTCELAKCGDGSIRVGVEQCDDSNAVSGDGCSNLCQLEFCGDGKINNHETCDPSVNLLNQQTCNLDCSPSSCGDGKLNVAAGEQCDNGPSPGNGCNAFCQFEHCGDGVRQGLEQCDLSDGPQPCSPTCHQEFCGNGIVDTDPVATPAIAEECDLGQANSNTGLCTLACRIARCGDGFTEAGVEGCDDGDNDDGDGCSATCVVERCGDGIINNGETCDPADTPATCNLDCTTNQCGDGKLNTAAGEQCDDGGTVPDDGCSATCKFERCGDQIVQPPEQCDGLGGTPPCSSSCHFEICGNGIVDIDPLATPAIAEECDLGLAINSNTGLCTLDCKIARCGDTFVEAGVEQCDNGTASNQLDRDCLPECRSNVCGDGFENSVGPDHIEACDDGPANTDAPACAYGQTCNACSTQCTQITVNHRCGDGAVDLGNEVCDDGNTDACGTCSASCGRITSHQATGMILAVDGASIHDGETFTIDDGRNAVQFEFNSTGGTPAANVPVPFNDGAGGGTPSTAAEVKAAIIAAIDAQHTLGTILIASYTDPANNNPALVLLRNDRPTSDGNQQIQTDVGFPGFFVFGMSGGEGGDCAANVACHSNEDCASFLCNSQHKCEPVPPFAPGFLTSVP